MNKKIPQLDAIRGIAILLVILHNTTDKYPGLHLQHIFASGWMGVDLFFVLSGFLITGILLDTRESAGYLKNFYARRVLRIWPLYYSVLVVIFVLIPLVRPAAGAVIYSARSSPWWSYPLFLQNFFVPVSQLAATSLGVTWSVAIEEQFYIVWPWVVKSCTARQLRRLALAVIVLSPILRLVLTSRHVNTYSNLFCRMDGLMAGALLAIVARSPRFRPARLIRPAWLCFLAAVPLALAAEAYGMRWLVHSLAVVAALSLVFLALSYPGRYFRAVMTNRFLIYTGTISYALYLIHKIVFDALQACCSDRYPILILIAGFAGSYTLAILSGHFLEQPFLRFKRFFVPRLAPEPSAGSSSMPLEILPAR